MTATRTTVGGRRLYSIDGEMYESVTAVIGRAVSKPALVGWACSMGATAALNGDPEPAGASVRHMRSAGNRGTNVHAWCEAKLLDLPLPEVSPAALPYVTALDAWLIDAKPTPVLVECVAYSPEHGYAGTLDGVWEIHGCRYLIDVKTSESPRVYPEHVLQLAAYRHAERLRMGLDVEWPRVDGCAVLTVSPERAALVPVDVGGDEFAAFLAALNLARWLWRSEA